MNNILTMGFDCSDNQLLITRGFGTCFEEGIPPIIERLMQYWRTLNELYYESHRYEKTFLLPFEWIKEKIRSLGAIHDLEIIMETQPIHLGLINYPEKWDEYNHFIKIIDGKKVELDIHDLEVNI